MSYHTDLQVIEDPIVNERTWKLRRDRTGTEPNGRDLKPMQLDWYKTWPKHPVLYNTTFPYYGNAVRAYRPPFTWKCTDYIQNPGYNTKKFGRPVDTGSDFTQTKTGYYDDDSQRYSGHYKNGIYEVFFDGTIYLVPWGFSHDGIIPSTSTSPPFADQDIATYGPRLWNWAKPAKPDWNGTQFIYELKDLKGQFEQIFERVSGLKSIADWYLAIKFGWEALYSDIVRFFRKLGGLHDRLEFLLKNAGKPVRGTAKYPTIVTTTVVSERQGSSSSGLNIDTDNRFGNPATAASEHKSNCTCTKIQDIWFSGQFVYYWDGPLPSKPELALSLLGLKVTPYEIWTILPWSWLVDWFLQVGTLLQTISAQVADHQFSNYAYIMGKTTREYVFFGTDGRVKRTVTKKFETKVRRRVNPFGSSTDPDSLTEDQWRILAALGIQRSSFDH